MYGGGGVAKTCDYVSHKRPEQHWLVIRNVVRLQAHHMHLFIHEQHTPTYFQVCTTCEQIYLAAGLAAWFNNLSSLYMSFDNVLDECKIHLVLAISAYTYIQNKPTCSLHIKLLNLQIINNYFNTNPMMNLVLPARAMRMAVGSMWGSRGPNIP